MDVDALNALTKKYPVSFTDENGDSITDKGWSYGVWYCGTSFTKVKLYGQYPPTFLRRALALFPDANAALIVEAVNALEPNECRIAELTEALRLARERIVHHSAFCSYRHQAHDDSHVLPKIDAALEGTKAQ